MGILNKNNNNVFSVRKRERIISLRIVYIVTLWWSMMQGRRVAPLKIEGFPNVLGDQCTLMNHSHTVSNTRQRACLLSGDIDDNYCRYEVCIAFLM